MLTTHHVHDHRVKSPDSQSWDGWRPTRWEIFYSEGRKEMDLTQRELKMLESCSSEEEWGAACDEIKAARKGVYPSDWWAKVKLSGMGDRVAARWGGDDKIHISVLI